MMDFETNLRELAGQARLGSLRERFGIEFTSNDYRG
jgi:8-amino-7-oxononanoate synthase